MRLAICDDDMLEREAITALLETYTNGHPEVEFDPARDVYRNGTELLFGLEASRKQNRPYDSLLLDVLMPGISGIEVAREIRSADEKVEIVFLTSSPEFAVDSYAVRANYYLLKPATEETLYPILDKLLEKLNRHEEALVIRSSQSIYSLPYASIEFLEVNHKILFFHMTGGAVKEVRAKLSDYADLLLTRPEFAQIHRSYIVNLDNMRELTAHEFTTRSGDVLPVARGLAKDVREAFVGRLFKSAEADLGGDGK